MAAELEIFSSFADPDHNASLLIIHPYPVAFFSSPITQLDFFVSSLQIHFYVMSILTPYGKIFRFCVRVPPEFSPPVGAFSSPSGHFTDCATWKIRFCPLECCKR